MRWTASITSLCCVRNALPKSVVHWMSSASRLTTSGSPASAWTLGSHDCFATASASALSFKSLFFVSHCWSCMISNGYVEAASTWASIGSGYSAIGATSESSCSGEITVASCCSGGTSPPPTFGVGLSGFCCVWAATGRSICKSRRQHNAARASLAIFPRSLNRKDFFIMIELPSSLLPLHSAGQRFKPFLSSAAAGAGLLLFWATLNSDICTEPLYSEQSRQVKKPHQGTNQRQFASGPRAKSLPELLGGRPRTRRPTAVLKRTTGVQNRLQPSAC